MKKNIFKAKKIFLAGPVFLIVFSVIILFDRHEESILEGPADEVSFMEEAGFDLVETAEAEEIEQAEAEFDPIPEDIIQVEAVSNNRSRVPRGFIAPGIIATRPDTFKLDKFGRMVCEKEKDKPGISTQGKPVHIDMECCLDPDEIPNPFCFYSPKRYGGMLADFERKKEKYFRKFLEGKGL